MVRLFKKKTDETTRSFKFEASLKLKDLPVEEYAHVTYAFQVAMLRFERMLKESLLESYITSTTLEKISQGLNLYEIRDLKVPETPTIEKVFGESSAAKLARQTEPIPKIVTKKIEEKIPDMPKEKPQVPVSKPTPVIPNISPEPSTPPKISFSFPTAPEKSKTTDLTPSEPTSLSPVKPEIPSIPKISFPSTSSGKPTSSPLGTLGRREEDRATGIAILRKQMLTELKKIRSVVSETEQH